MISWKNNTIEALQDIVGHFNKHLGRCIETFADFYIERNNLFLKFDDYAMCFSNSLEYNNISDGVYKLAFVCDLSYLIDCISNNNKYEQKVIEVNDVYKYTSKILTYTFPIVSFLNQKQLRFNDYFLVDILKNVLKEDRMNKYNQRNIDIISIAYYLTLDLINVDKEYSIYELHNLITESQSLDLSILTSRQIKSIKEVLGVKRTIFVRVLLILSNEMIRNEHTIEKIIERSKFTNKKEFVECLNNPIEEVSIFLTSYRLKHDKIMF